MRTPARWNFTGNLPQGDNAEAFKRVKSDLTSKAQAFAAGAEWAAYRLGSSLPFGQIENIYVVFGRFVLKGPLFDFKEALAVKPKEPATIRRIRVADGHQTVLREWDGSKWNKLKKVGV